MTIVRFASLALAATLALPATSRAQQNGTPQAEPSGRARASVTLRRPPSRDALAITIDYGQPHARGRQVAGGVVPYDRVWRTGANAATSFTTDVDLTVGGARVPKGSYTLYTLPTRAGWKLIINRQTGQWGTEYDASRDLARVDLRARTLREAQESFTIWLVPSGGGRGTLRMAWGTTELNTEWVAR